MIRTESSDYKDRGYSVVLADVVEKSNFVHWLYVAIYNLLLRYHQSWMKYYCELIELAKPNNSEFGYRLAFAYARKLLLAVNPVVVVSVHPMANHYLARILKALNLPHQPKLVVVVTDPNAKLWSGWACHDADLTIAPNHLVRDSLISLGVRSEKIITIGMPVNPQFLQPPAQDRESFLRSFALDPKLTTLCLSAGRAGGGNIARIYAALAQVRGLFQVIVICGDNSDLFNEITELSNQTKFQTVIVQKLNTMSEAMSACDLLVTKAGGLTTYEAIARRLPMAIDMLTEPMPQEVGTAEMLIETGLAKAIKQPSDIVSIVETLQRRDRFKDPLPSEYNLDRVDAVYDIARLILSTCQAGVEAAVDKVHA